MFKNKYIIFYLLNKFLFSYKFKNIDYFYNNYIYNSINKLYLSYIIKNKYKKLFYIIYNYYK